jgi:Flp pilus assembly pilin Flp
MSMFISVKNLLSSMTDDDAGASVVEYALLISLIAAVALVAIASFGSALSSEYSDIAATMP